MNKELDVARLIHLKEINKLEIINEVNKIGSKEWLDIYKTIEKMKDQLKLYDKVMGY